MSAAGPRIVQAQRPRSATTRSAAACSSGSAVLQAVRGASFALDARPDAGGGRRIGLRQVARSPAW